MKFLFLILLILVVIWAIKRTRINTTPPKNTPPAAASNMIVCAHCGIHLPQDEAVMGEKGVYCSTEHRTAAQDRNPA